MMIKKIVTASILVCCSIASTAQAALQGRDLNGSIDSFEAYYDTVLDITWLDVNSGAMGQEAAYWATSLSIVDAVNNNTYDNWRLPTTLQPDASCDSQPAGGSSGYFCNGSEMGHLFYSELGGTAGLSILTSADPDLAKFTNLQAFYYWSGTEYAPNTGYAWTFRLSGGYQTVAGKSNGLYALAVSPGDVAAVPEAETYALMLAGLGLIGWRMRRRG